MVFICVGVKWLFGWAFTLFLVVYLFLWRRMVVDVDAVYILLNALVLIFLGCLFIWELNAFKNWNVFFEPFCILS